MKKTTTTKTKPQRMFAMAMAAAMVVSMAPTAVFAAEESAPAGESGGTSQEASGQNASSDSPKVTITVTKSDDGSETKETKTEKTEADGTKTERTETTTTSETKEDNDKGGTTSTVESNTEYKETTTEPTKTEPKTDGGDDGEGSEGDAPAEGGEGSEGTEPAEGGEGSEENKPAEGNTETGYVEGSEASQFEEGKTTDVTTETEGSEHSSDTTVTDHKDRVVEESGYSGGSETTTTTETVTDKYIEDRDELENDEYIEGEEETLVDDKGEFDNNGSVDTTTTSTPIDPGYAGDITITLTPGGNGEGSAAVDEGKLYEDLLADDRPESSETKGEAQVEDVTDNDGNKIGTKTTTEDIKTDVKDVTNKVGDVVGYETTKTTTTTVVTETKAHDTNPIDPTVETGDPVTTTSEPVTTIDLPDRPTAGESRDEATGKTTITTVEDIVDDDGNVVGYNVSTVTKNAAGDEIAWGGESIWGTKTVIVTTTETLETTTTKTEYITTTTTTTDITEGKTVNGVWIESTARQATASMGQVTVGEVHGRADLEALDVDTATLLANLATNDLFNPKDHVADKQIDGELFHYVGHLVGSDYRIYRQNGSNTDVYIYVLKDADGNEFYGYCADVATSAVKGTLYEIGNIEDEDYYQGRDAEDHIRGIALNGFWGTAEGTGSLDAVKKLLKDAGYSKWNTLTEGQALAATQAAMWKFGNNGTASPVVAGNVTQYQYYKVNGNYVANPTQGDANVQALYNILINKTAAADTSTNILDTGDILSSQITIGEKAEDARNNDTNTKNDVYNTDISFTVALVPDSNDNLKAVVYQGGQQIGEQALNASNGTTDANGNTTYTLNGLALQEGVNINLSLEGTQNLKQGVYLYTATLGVGASQTFVGVAEGKRSVDLDVNMKFEVDDETATRKNKSGSNSRSKQDKKVTQTTDTAINEEVVALMEITTVTVTEHGNEWGEEYREEFKYNDKDKDKEKEKEKDKEKDKDKDKDEDKGREEYIIDEDVPLEDIEIPLGDIILDDVPKTNDASALWLALSGFSGIGLAGLFGRKRRK